MQHKVSTVEDYGKRMDQLKNYIINNLDKQLTVENLAEKTNYSPYHFHRVFHEFTGETPGNFITRSRMKKAGELLMTGKLRIGEIAVKVGYNALSSLTKNFNKFYGVSPLQFRKNYKASA